MTDISDLIYDFVSESEVEDAHRLEISGNNVILVSFPVLTLSSPAFPPDEAASLDAFKYFLIVYPIFILTHIITQIPSVQRSSSLSRCIPTQLLWLSIYYRLCLLNALSCSFLDTRINVYTCTICILSLHPLRLRSTRLPSQRHWRTPPTRIHHTSRICHRSRRLKGL